MIETENWYVLCVRSRHEFVTTERLRRQGVEVFLPTVSKRRRWSDREKLVTFPVFPGYLFVQVRPGMENFLSIIRISGSVSFITFDGDRPVPVDPDEMKALLLVSGGEHAIDVYPHLCEGARVRVKRGPLQGADGMLVRKDGGHLFLVNICILGRSLGTKINAEDLEAA